MARSKPTHRSGERERSAPRPALSFPRPRVHWLEIAAGSIALVLVVIHALHTVPALPIPGLTSPSIVAMPAPAYDPSSVPEPVDTSYAWGHAVAAPSAGARPSGLQRLTGYVDGYPQLHLGGSSRVQIDNSVNNADVFVNLVRISGDDAVATRTVLVRAGDIFTIFGVERGRYELRYRDLRSGVPQRTAPFELVERHSTRGVSDSETSIRIIPHG
jgi:hypothetical protein